RNTHIAYTHSGEDMVFLDPSLLSQIVMNLLSNAIKFSPEGAAIEVTTAVRPENVELSVTDHGIGIPDEYRPHAFERFHRGANALNIQGTGLGLHIAKTYAVLMNGAIDYTSQAGKGTQFMVRFPSTLEKGSASPEKGGAADRAA
ncbi:MAG TPA: sensor histidine kinase, partial [Puia sp.]|nr:sensor histidine kinase [Puia sp.]